MFLGGGKKKAKGKQKNMSGHICCLFSCFSYLILETSFENLTICLVSSFILCAFKVGKGED